MGPKHSQPLAVSERQEWLGPLQKGRAQGGLGWAELAGRGLAGRAGLGWAGAGLALLGCWAGWRGWTGLAGASCLSDAAKGWECLGPIPDRIRRVPTSSDRFRCVLSSCKSKKNTFFLLFWSAKTLPNLSRTRRNPSEAVGSCREWALSISST